MSVDLQKAECEECGASEDREPLNRLYTRDSREDDGPAPDNLMVSLCSECGAVMGTHPVGA